jgi:hypothetical protein
MTFEEAVEILSGPETEKEYLQDSDKWLEGLTIINQYMPGFDFIGAEHDILYVVEWLPHITVEHLLKLHRYGFHLNDDTECWARHI